MRRINLRTHKDPTGMTAAQAVKEAEQRFNKDPKFVLVYKNDTMHARVHPCGGQAIIGGRATTRGCGNNHLQPCPGGPLVYEISRLTSGSMGLSLNVIEARGDSWRDCLDKIDRQREEDRKKFKQYRAERAAAKAAQACAEAKRKRKSPKRRRAS